MLNESELLAIRKRAENAAQDPWKAFVEGRDMECGSSFIRTQGGDIEMIGATTADYDFIANARQDIVLLLDEIERLQAGKTIRAQWLFFDLGTTLIDESAAYEHGIRDAIAGTGITYEQFHEKRVFFAKQSLRGDVEALRFFGLHETPWHFEDERLYPGTLPLLESLLQKGYRLGVIANQEAGIVQRMQALGIRHYFEVVVSSAEFGKAKPDRSIFLEALRLAGCAPENAVMTGDRLDNDIYPAAELGMQAIWVKQGFSAYQVLDSGRPAPNYTVENLQELAQLF